ncbi:Magnesium transport [Lecanosticta acicola]|uniref:Magnesium transport n=1 Tax=Lecanosticta acicola TaxID=111012 RepID=A0AAI8YWD6_9PEZI|nr:Magnesium transport [Lecanosticta acicola]
MFRAFASDLHAVVLNSGPLRHQTRLKSRSWWRHKAVNRNISTSVRLSAKLETEFDPVPRPHHEPIPVSASLWRRLFHNSRADSWTSRAGEEPGIDPTSKLASQRFSQQHDSESEICIVDFSDQRVIKHDVEVASLDSFLKEQPRPSWASCRWIYVNGINWDVVRSLGSEKGLHPLAIEDVMDTGTSTKVNWYDDHCFLEMNLVKLEHIHDDRRTRVEDDPVSSSLRDRIGSRLHPRWRTLVPGRFRMTVEQVSMFLTADNTFITFFERSGEEVLNPIISRLESPKSTIRSSNDPSMLLHAVIDTVVDLSLPIGKAYAQVFDDLEQSVLRRPNVAQSKELHILRSGLTLLMDNSIANGSLLKTLVDHRAAIATADGNLNDPVTSVHISSTAQIYLQDVQDHIAALSNSTDMSIRSADNLSSLIFNTIAASQNESISKLTFVSSFFLPLTFLTSYFGMNFDPMPVVNEHSDAYFWVIATPIMLITATLLTVRANLLKMRLPWRNPKTGQRLSKGKLD